MLSRAAETLYWMARYIERAEDITRLLAVNFDALLDIQPEDARAGWLPLITITGDQSLYTNAYGDVNPRSIIEFLLWHPDNPNAVTACINRARENARTVREQISSEMWEHINRLYFLVRDINRTAVLNSPSEFFNQIRNGSQAFQGITNATLTHADSYQFMELGFHLERADKTARILDAKYLYVSSLAMDSAETYPQLIALLRSCSAFEPFRRTAKGELNLERVVDYLLLDRSFPRAVLFCINRSLQAIDKLGSDNALTLKSEHPRRTLGRLSADLEYLDIHELLGEGMDPYLDKLLYRLNAIGDDVARAYFNTRVILPDSRPQYQQQQQQ
jgi:uncharacterized alpha-E superfamily protein